MDTSNKCWNRLYFKSGKDIKPFLGEFLNEVEDGVFVIDFEKIAPVPQELLDVPEFTGPENVEPELLEKYKNNVSLYGVTDSVRWKDNYWGGGTSVYSGSFVNNDKFYDFWTEFNPAVMVAEFLSIRVEENDKLVLDYKNEDPEHGFYGRHMTRAENESDGFYMPNKVESPEQVQQVEQLEQVEQVEEANLIN